MKICETSPINHKTPSWFIVAFKIKQRSWLFSSSNYVLFQQGSSLVLNGHSWLQATRLSLLAYSCWLLTEIWSLLTDCCCLCCLKVDYRVSFLAFRSLISVAVVVLSLLMHGFGLLCVDSHLQFFFNDRYHWYLLDAECLVSVVDCRLLIADDLYCANLLIVGAQLYLFFI